MHALGVGPNPVPRRELSVENLTKGIRHLLTDEAMRLRAANLGAGIRAKDGVGRPAELLEQHFYAGMPYTAQSKK